MIKKFVMNIVLEGEKAIPILDAIPARGFDFIHIISATNDKKVEDIYYLQHNEPEASKFTKKRIKSYLDKGEKIFVHFKTNR